MIKNTKRIIICMHIDYQSVVKSCMRVYMNNYWLFAKASLRTAISLYVRSMVALLYCPWN